MRLLVLTGAGVLRQDASALEAARQNAASFANGAAFVELAPLRDPGLVLDTIAATLGIHEQPGGPLETLTTVLRSRAYSCWSTTPNIYLPQRGSTSTC